MKNSLRVENRSEVASVTKEMAIDLVDHFLDDKVYRLTFEYTHVC
jgi:hypothetical protein